MGLYMTHEAGFELPASWIDASITLLEYTRPGGLIRVGLSRTQRGGKDLAALMAERLSEQRRKLPIFELIAQVERMVAGLASIDVSALYEDASQKNYQRSLSFVLGNRFVILGVSGVALHRDEIDAIFERAALTLTRRSPQGGD